jgi:chorismate mutase
MAPADILADAPQTDAPQTDAPEALDMIPVLREQIDALDEAIVRLVAERVRVSQRIQTVRVNSGGARVELGRERVVLNSYRTGLGPAGSTLAEAVLQVCRGAR